MDAKENKKSINEMVNNKESRPSNSTGKGKDKKKAKAVLNKLNQPPDLMLCLIVLIAIFYILGICFLLNFTPSQQVSFVLIALCILFWICSIITFCLYSERRSDQFFMDQNPIQFFIFLLINLIVIAAMISMFAFMFPEFLYPTSSVSFRRLGSVSHQSASFFIREPSEKYINSQPFVKLRKKGQSIWNITSSPVALQSSKDYSAFATVNGLDDSSEYEWVWSIDYDETKANSNINSTTYLLKTFPAPGSPSKLRFLFGSCLIGGFPNFRNGSSFSHVIPKFRPDFFAFLGDLIYADNPLFKGNAVSSYWSLYRHSLINIIDAVRELPMFFVFDDHELENNYDKGNNTEMYENAINGAWKVYAGNGNPQNNGLTYFNVDYGNIAMFFMDSRTYRATHIQKDSPSKSMLGSAQKQELKDWLLAKNATSKFKIIFCSVGFTADFADSLDSWPGFMNERSEITDFIINNTIQGVILITGDTHFPYVAEIGGFNKTGIFEFSASPVGTAGNYDPGVAAHPQEVLWYDDNEGKKFGYESKFGILDIDTTTSNPTVSINIYDAQDNTMKYTLNLDLNKLSRST